MELTRKQEEEVEKIRAENAALKIVIKDRTAELEVKTRELAIETALDNVRTVALAMTEPADMLNICRIISSQLENMGIGGIRNVQTAIINESKGTYFNYEYFRVHEKSVITEVEYRLHPEVNAFVKQVLTEPDAYFTKSFEGDELKGWIEYQEQAKQYVDPILLESVGVHYYFYSIGPGALGISTYDTTLKEEGLSVLKRFRNAFFLAFRRYSDIQKAEAQAKEARIEAALERVRAKVMGMKNSDDLKSTSFVFGDQLNKLGMDWVFSYFWLIEEEAGTHTFWITWPDSNTSMTSYFLADADEYTLECLAAWKNGNRMHSNHIAPRDTGSFFKAFAQIVNDAQGKATEIMQPGNFLNGVYYYDAMMKYGSLGICMNRAVTEEENMIQCRFAIEFERAYTRFLDLKQAENLAEQAEIDLVRLKEEKLRTEMALTELKTAQSQLIQAEKMASLGELTAGIAHEIQNPLNFVNNFSEVSCELLEEMKEELLKGNTGDALGIATDLERNLEKINHHGKRADAIVKSMLQHSRSSSGKNEPTDINALADEYLRLAYHGLRARDKTFNATLKTQFDDSVGMVTVLTQDLGRVILNLITNAFYAVSEKKKLNILGYEPTIMVSTKKLEDKVQITVADNGTGIPKRALDKIFQPFFTTKPTGQGTGLGLSLSYDIITKGHGGELKVETIEGEGTNFIIQITSQPLL